MKGAGLLSAKSCIHRLGQSKHSKLPIARNLDGFIMEYNEASLHTMKKSEPQPPDCPNH